MEILGVVSSWATREASWTAWRRDYTAKCGRLSDMRAATIKGGCGAAAPTTRSESMAAGMCAHHYGGARHGETRDQGRVHGGRHARRYHQGDARCGGAHGQGRAHDDRHVRRHHQGGARRSEAHYQGQVHGDWQKGARSSSSRCPPTYTAAATSCSSSWTTSTAAVPLSHPCQCPHLWA
jgi:hypothetical protein